MRWLDPRRAACRGQQEVYDDPTRTTEARRICRDCPLQQPCAVQALLNGDVGVWGGTTDVQRGRIRHALQRDGKLAA